MEQFHELERSKRQKSKKIILRQERYFPIVAISIVLIAFFTPIIMIYGIIQVDMGTITTIIRVLVLVPFVLIMLIPIWKRAVWYQKKKWMSCYGQQVAATITGIKLFLLWSPIIYLEWCDPQTGKTHHCRIIVPRSQTIPTGDPFPLWIDPSDPDFYCPDW